ncbi:MAG: Radical SAM superfamily protein [Methanosaeta sp. PtaB.Bin039]|nr:MAG: Radical SAM superfamily protein [Methanosaeta sp. PtaB.Bin039]
MASYNHLSRQDLQALADEAVKQLGECRICPRCCQVDRLAGDRGFCRIGRLARVSSAGPHYGEEPPLVGQHGSGTIFFAGCNLSCIFCQNYEISQQDEGVDLQASALARVMVRLQEAGCHNINLVSPSHVVPQILEALAIASQDGLSVPLVYNSGGYDRVRTLRLLEGIVDIYMPDAKYSNGKVAAMYSAAPDYPERMMQAISEMHRQVGDLQIVEGLAVRGLLVRHLVLPGGLAGTAEVMRHLADLSPETYVNVMDQYRPEYRACQCPELDRSITPREYRIALEMARAAGLHRGFS